MGKLRRLKNLRRALRGTHRQLGAPTDWRGPGVRASLDEAVRDAHVFGGGMVDLRLCKADPEAYVALDSPEGRAELAKLHPPPLRIRRGSEADDFYVGESFTVPPEALGLEPIGPTDPEVRVTVTAVDQELGTVTLDTPFDHVAR